MAEGVLKIALIGAGMFGGDVHARAFADVQRNGIGGNLGRLGLDDFIRDVAQIRFELVGVATRTQASAERVVKTYQEQTGHRPEAYSGETPWRDVMQAHPDLDVVAVATPDHLHTPVILDALERGCHVITEKPMCLDMEEADRIVEQSAARNRVVAVDMHKRYDPDHLRVRDDVMSKIGEPLYGRAVLEEPLEVSTSTFKWAEHSDPFSYVGPHWTDLFYHYYHAKPVSLTAVGQKKRLIRDGINAYDAVQVRVEFDNGMSITFQNHWITPEDFEGNVNQEHEIVGTEGKVESDQQYRGFRYWYKDGGFHSANNHFTRDVVRPDGSKAYVGYGTDSIVAGLLAVVRVQYFGASLKELEGTYPTAEEGRITVAIVHAARIVRDRNFQYQQEGKFPAVTSGFGEDGITIIDPYQIHSDPDKVFERIYEKPI